MRNATARHLLGILVPIPVKGVAPVLPDGVVFPKRLEAFAQLKDDKVRRILSYFMDNLSSKKNLLGFLT
jgi:hypothetical protein